MGGLTLGAHQQSDSPVPDRIGNPMFLVNATRLFNNVTEINVVLSCSVGFRRSCNGSSPIVDFNVRRWSEFWTSVAWFNGVQNLEFERCSTTKFKHLKQLLTVYRLV
jgi:hypothetical protein